MPSQADVLLQAVQALSESAAPAVAGAAPGAVDRARVTALGAALGWDSSQIVSAADELQEKGFLDFSWDGRVKVTSEGLAHLGGRPESMGPNSIYAGPGAIVARDINAQHAAVGAGAKNEETQTTTTVQTGVNVEQLTAALVELRKLMPQLSVQTQQEVAALDEAVQDVIRTAPTAQATPTPPRTGQAPAGAVAQEPKALQTGAFERVLDRAKSIVDRVGGITEAAGKLGPVLTVIRMGLHLVGVPI